MYKDGLENKGDDDNSVMIRIIGMIKQNVDPSNKLYVI